ncbi:MAG: hypothetical protein C5B51_09810 [Terriglobia bacterium]|nr:MAG: hypothetical protein C5B51_09810 [Terriglobia bacterium]
MVFRGHIFLIALAALPLRADLLIDVTAAPTALLQPSDELVFRFDIQGYERIAGQFGAPSLPRGMQFIFVSEPADMGRTFSASLASSDGTYALLLPGTLSFLPGSFQGDNYNGPVATLSGAFTFSPGDSSGLFGNSPVAYLHLRDVGSPVNVGLHGYNLGQDLYVSLGDGSLSVGGSVLAVEGPAPLAPVPEPATGWLVAAAALCLAARVASRAKPNSTPRIE